MLTKVYLMVWVSDMDRASSFYKQALGLAEAYRSPAWTEMRFGDTMIALHRRGAPIDQHHTGLGFEVDDLDRACTAVADAGGQIVAGPTVRADEGIRVADCADPEGNRFSLSQTLN